MHIFFVNKYQTKLTKSIDKTYIDIFLKTWVINSHDTIPYLSSAAGFQESQVDHFPYPLLIILDQL